MVQNGQTLWYEMVFDIWYKMVFVMILYQLTNRNNCSAQMSDACPIEHNFRFDQE